MTIVLDALTVQDGGGGSAAFAVLPAHQDTQGIMDQRALVIGNPFTEDMINGFPMRKVRRQITPRTATFLEIENGIYDSAPIFGRASAFGGFGEHGLKISPLVVRWVRSVKGDLHRLIGATPKESQTNRQQ